MNAPFLFNKLFLLAIVLSCGFKIIAAQELPKVPNTDKTEDEILRISSDLIQIGVSVFDKNGNFIHDVKQDDFELRVDGKVTPLSFFEAAVRKHNASIEKPAVEKISDAIDSTANAVRQSRTIVFVVDDLHLSLESHKRTRELINKFINQEMTPDDMAAIVSTTGKIGFLQQLTDNKAVLRAALERLVFSPNRAAGDRFNPPMSEYEAQLIDRYDLQVTDSFAEYLIKDYPPAIRNLEKTKEDAREQVRSRARDISLRAGIISKGTYSALEQSVRHSSSQSGRKILFFISDGFLLDPSNTDSAYRLDRITDAAARTNTVIYSFDAKGLEVGLPDSTVEVSRNALSTKELSAAYRVTAGASFESQDGLSALAARTGGRFIHNTNDLQNGLAKALEEASLYYLLAWQPDSENIKLEKLNRIEVRLKNRPELKIRVQSGYLSGKLNSTDKIKIEKNKNSEKEPRDNIRETELPTVTLSSDQLLSNTINTPFQARALPVALSVKSLGMANDKNEISVTVQIKSNSVDFVQEGIQSNANLNILGIIYDSTGKSAAIFGGMLNAQILTTELNSPPAPDITYNYKTPIKWGLYQIRLAVRDEKSGRIGSINQWIEIPELSSRKLTQ